MTDKPPRQSIRALIRKAIDNRYSMRAQISADGKVCANGWLNFDCVADWHTTRSSSGSVRLYARHVLFFTFGPDA
jgi:hypothetical protein